MVSHWRLSDSKSPRVSRTLLSILAVFNNDVVWMVSARPPTSKSSRPFINPLVTVPKAPITIVIIVTFTFHSFFNSLARSRYSSLFSHSFSFILWLLLLLLSLLQIVSSKQFLRLHCLYYNFSAAVKSDLFSVRIPKTLSACYILSLQTSCIALLPI